MGITILILVAILGPKSWASVINQVCFVCQWAICGGIEIFQNWAIVSLAAAQRSQISSLYIAGMLCESHGFISMISGLRGNLYPVIWMIIAFMCFQKGWIHGHVHQQCKCVAMFPHFFQHLGESFLFIRFNLWGVRYHLEINLKYWYLTLRNINRLLRSVIRLLLVKLGAVQNTHKLLHILKI